MKTAFVTGATGFLGVSLAQKVLGYTPSSLHEMVGDCVAWMRAEGC